MRVKNRQKVEEIFQVALDYKSVEREAYLNKVCASDTELRREVESFLDDYEDAGSFIETPAFEIGLMVLTEKNASLSKGETLSSYTIIEQLGAGGMGEVYLAEDVRLGRKVALKLLSLRFTQSPEQLKRFRQEARAASGLNHPNILTVYEVGAVGDKHFIATEYIEGQTLRQRLIERQMDLPEVMDVAMQIATALVAAHSAGIVHRDIKPENIMLRDDGYLKLLDFGIAKLTETHSQLSKNIEAITKRLTQTEPGMLVGTVKYMSPEQARGLKVDHRTDIWSLGVVLYEMLTGNAPFDGETQSDVIASILAHEPAPLNQYITNAPVELEQLVNRCLNKDINLRYQSATDLLDDIVHIGEKIGTATNLRRAARIGSTRGIAANSGRSQVTTNPIASYGPGYDQNEWKHKSVVSVLKKLFVDYKKSVALALLFALVGSFSLFVYLRNKPATQNFFQIKNISQLTNTGNVTSACISPDGKYVAYVINDSGQQSLWVSQIVAPSPRQILPANGKPLRKLTISPDSNYIYYLSIEEKGNVLYSMPFNGGTPRKILDDVDSPVTFSPDGKQIAFVRGSYEQKKIVYALMIANADGSVPLKIVKRRTPNDNFSPDGPAWSPDGKSIVLSAERTSVDGNPLRYLTEVDINDGTEKQTFLPDWGWIGRVVWLKDGHSLVMLAAKSIYSYSSRQQIVEVSYPEFIAHEAKRDLIHYSDISITANADAIVTVGENRLSHIWTTENGDKLKQITPGVGGAYHQPSWTPEGGIIYAAEMGNSRDIWEMNADVKDPKQVTFNLQGYAPKVSPDDKHIIFASDRTGTSHIWLKDRNGGSLTQLTNSSGEYSPSFSSDGKWVYYTVKSEGMEHLWKVRIDGGDAAQVLDYPSRIGVPSPDGKWIASIYFDENSKWRVGIFPIDGGPATKTFDITVSGQVLRWASDSQAIAYIGSTEKMDNIWIQPINGGQKKQLTNFTSSADKIFFFDWSHDNNRLVCLRGTVTRDVIYLIGSK